MQQPIDLFNNTAQTAGVNQPQPVTSVQPMDLFPNTSANYPQSISAKYGNVAGTAYAALEGIDMGAKTVGTILAKGAARAVNWGTDNPVDKFLTNHGISPQNVQNWYEQQHQIYNNDPDTNIHPYAAGAGNVLGSGVVATPVLGLLGAGTGLGTGALGETAAKAVPQSMSLLARGIGNAADYGAQGYLAGGATPTQGEGANMWNQQNANNGAEMGALFSTAPTLLGNYMGKVSNLENTYQNMNTTVNGTPVQYNGLLGDSALNQSNPMFNWIGKQVNQLNRIPGLNALTGTLKGLGDTDASQTQLSNVSSYMNDYVNALAGKGGITAAPTTIVKGIQNTQNLLKNEMSNSFTNELLPAAESAGKTQIPITGPLASQIESLTGNQNINKYLSSDALAKLNNGIKTGSMNIQDIMGPQGVMQEIGHTKNDLMNMYSSSSNLDSKLAANDLYSLYGNFRGQLQNQLAGTAAEAPLHNFQTISQAHFAFNDVPGIANAVDQLNTVKKGAVSLVGNLLKGNQSPEWQSTVLGASGQGGVDATSALSINKALQSTTQDGIVNGAAFMKKLSQQPQMIQQLNKPTVNVMQGLNQYMQNIKGTTDLPLPIVGWALRNSIAKNAIIGLNDTVGNPGITQYLTNKITDLATKGGIINQTANSTNQ